MLALFFAAPLGAAGGGVAVSADVLRERVEELLPSAMQAHDVDLWLVFTREEAADPLAADLGGGDAVARMALLFDRSQEGLRKTAIAASYDVVPLEETGIYDEVLSYKSEGIKPHLKNFVTALDPQRIAVNVSRDMPIADGLTAGMRNYLEEVLGEDIAARFVSSEPLVASFRGRRLPSEVKILREAARHTDRFIRTALSRAVITPGVTSERDVGAYLRSQTAEVGATVPFISVVAGPSRGHADPSGRVIHPGDLVRIDFGITLNGYSTDLQRTAYVLRAGESAPPPQILKMWETARKAADLQIAAMKPGVSGTEIDAIARSLFEQGRFRGPPARHRPRDRFRCPRRGAIARTRLARALWHHGLLEDGGGPDVRGRADSVCALRRRGRDPHRPRGRRRDHKQRCRAAAPTAGRSIPDSVSGESGLRLSGAVR